jgi:hypothetical protein
MLQILNSRSSDAFLVESGVDEETVASERLAESVRTAIGLYQNATAGHPEAGERRPHPTQAKQVRRFVLLLTIGMALSSWSGHVMTRRHSG